MRAWRADHKRVGLCIRCNGDAVPGLVMCQRHRVESIEKTKLRYSELVERNLCVRCARNPPAPGIRRCRPCADVMREYYRKYRTKS
jgi:hypothetical protein